MQKLFCFLMLMMSTASVIACTTWASIGAVNQHGGVLLVKNRDGSHHSREKLALVTPLHGYKYLGLIYNTTGNTTGFPYISAGINQYNLVVVNNAASTIPTTHRDAGESKTMTTILAHYHSVAQVLKDQQKLFSTGLVNNLLIADQHRIALVEIGKHGVYCVWSKTSGYLYHTNQFECKKLQTQNLHNYPDSLVRYQTIGDMLKAMKRPFTFDAFYSLTNRQQHGPNNSLFREWTDATWIVTLPKQGHGHLYVRFTDPIQRYHVYRIALTPELWRQGKLANQH